MGFNSGGYKNNINWWEVFRGPRTQASLFHYIVEEKREEPFRWRDLLIGWEIFRGPKTQASLFHYFPPQEPETPFRWQDLFKTLFSNGGALSFTLADYADPHAVVWQAQVAHKKKNQARLISMGFHASMILLAVILSRPSNGIKAKSEETVVFLGDQITIPWDLGPSTGSGGGGGGGGKQEPTPPSGGRMPETSPVQMVPPDPESPQPLVPADDIMQAAATVAMPIDIPQDETLPVGDLAAPLTERRSSGTGLGGGIGNGVGTGIGPGTGPGVGPGSGGGMGGGEGGGIGSGKGSGIGPYRIGSGVSEPVLIYKTLPNYTDEARKNRVEGIVMLEVVIRSDGRVDNARIVRGLGFGLDESAIREVVTKWKFRPGTLQGRPVDVQAYIEVSFRLL